MTGPAMLLRRISSCPHSGANSESATVAPATNPSAVQARANSGRRSHSSSILCALSDLHALCVEFRRFPLVPDPRTPHHVLSPLQELLSQAPSFFSSVFSVSALCVGLGLCSP